MSTLRRLIPLVTLAALLLASCARPPIADRSLPSIPGPLTPCYEPPEPRSSGIRVSVQFLPRRLSSPEDPPVHGEASLEAVLTNRTRWPFQHYGIGDDILRAMRLTVPDGRVYRLANNSRANYPSCVLYAFMTLESGGSIEVASPEYSAWFSWCLDGDPSDFRYRDPPPGPAILTIDLPLERYANDEGPRQHIRETIPVQIPELPQSHPPTDDASAPPQFGPLTIWHFGHFPYPTSASCPATAA